MHSKKAWIYLVFLFVILQIFDSFTTHLFISAGGVANELNPIMRVIFENYGIIGILVFKLVGVFMLVYLLGKRFSLRFRCNVLMIGVGCIYCSCCKQCTCVNVYVRFFQLSPVLAGLFYDILSMFYFNV